MIEVSDERFDEMVNDAIDAIPEEFARELTQVVFVVQDFNEDNPGILGIFEGTMRTERTFHHTGYLPDVIAIYKGALELYCTTEEQLAEEVKVTVFHEVGHYFGLEEDDLHRLGWG